MLHERTMDPSVSANDLVNKDKKFLAALSLPFTSD